MPSYYRNQTLASALAQPPILHTVTLVHPATGDERRISVWTKTDSFSDVQLAVDLKCAELRLKDYQVFSHARVDQDIAAMVERIGLGTLLIQLHHQAAQQFQVHRRGPDQLDSWINSEYLEVIDGLQDLIMSAQMIDGLYFDEEMEEEEVAE